MKIVAAVLAKYASVFSMSLRGRKYLPYLSSSGLPPAAPSQYDSASR